MPSKKAGSEKERTFDAARSTIGYLSFDVRYSLPVFSVDLPLDFLCELFENHIWRQVLQSFMVICNALARNVFYIFSERWEGWLIRRHYSSCHLRGRDALHLVGIVQVILVADDQIPQIS